MQSLLVHYQGWGERWLLGTLADNGRQLLFEYSAEALRQGLDLSPLHLRLQAAAHGGFPAHQHRLPGLIADALPDGWGLLLLDRLVRQGGINPATLSPLDRLAFIGDRALGALAFEPAQPLALTQRDWSLLALAQDARRVLAGQGAAALKDLAFLGGSPQGARPKVLVYVGPSTAAISTTAQPGMAPWLVKFPAAGEHKEACAVEDLYADQARRCGLDMPATRWFDLGPKLVAFGIARFDREGEWRVPLHSLAGAMHADFRLPGAVDATTFLRATRLFTRDEREVRKAFERVAFNVLFHNRDDHPKNFAFRLGRDRGWRLAPCFDLTWSEGPGGQHQMDVCGEGQAITRALMLKLAEQGGLTRAWAATVLDRMVELAGQLPTLAAERPIRRTTVARLVASVEGQRARWR